MLPFQKATADPRPDDLQTKDPKLDSFYNQVNLHRSVICKEIEMAEAWKGKYGKFGTREKLIERFQFGEHTLLLSTRCQEIVLKISL